MTRRSMADIARQVGVSVSTVSRALSDNPKSTGNVSAATRQSIEKIAEQSGYRKRRSATRRVAFVIDHDLFQSPGQFYSAVIAGVQEEAMRQGCVMQFLAVSPGQSKVRTLGLDPATVAGIIVVGVFHDDLVLELRQMSAPMIMVDYHLPAEDIPAVLVDNPNGILKACKFLADLGHRRVAHIAGDSRETSSHERLYGFREARSLYGLEIADELIVESDGSIGGGLKAAERLLSLTQPPTAIVAYSDLVAIGAMDAAKKAGVRVPDELSVVGFDDIALASEVVPSLTTVQVPKRAIGALAVRWLLGQLQHNEEPIAQIVVSTSLVVRDSTGRKP